MLLLHQDSASVKMGHDKTVIQGQIDRLAYELYGLTEEAIGMVEEATGEEE